MLEPDIPVYLVGGAVRDALLGRPVHDLDFAVPGASLQIARRVANELKGAFYPLDQERETGRVILKQANGARLTLDFALYQGSDLESDLRSRDFTINAMALNVRQPQSLVDPLGGAADLRAKQLRACSQGAFLEDPVRVLRGIRQANMFNLHILPDTREQMRQAAHLLPNVSPERLRDELFRILDGPRPATSLRALHSLGVLPYLLPELTALEGVTQSPPHIADVWRHTLDILQKMETVLAVLQPQPDADLAANLHMGLVSILLGRYREQIHAHLNTQLNPNRSLRALLFLSALYHDAGKPETWQVDEEGRIRFFNHEQVGAQLVNKRAQALHLSNSEIDRLKVIIRNHMRPLLLGQAGQLPTRRAIYRFFRQTRKAGIDICLLSLADMLATYGPTLSQGVWAHHLEVVRTLMEAWWELANESVSPPPVLTGNDLINELNLVPGPKIGQLLEAIQEAQATGEVKNRSEALALARSLL